MSRQKFWSYLDFNGRPRLRVVEEQGKLKPISRAGIDRYEPSGNVHHDLRNSFDVVTSFAEMDAKAAISALITSSDDSNGHIFPVKHLTKEEIAIAFKGRDGVERVSDELKLESYTRCLVRNSKVYSDRHPFIKEMTYSLRFYCYPRQMTKVQRQKLAELYEKFEAEDRNMTND